MKDLGGVRKILDINITRKRKSLYLHNRIFKFFMESVKEVSVPLRGHYNFILINVGSQIKKRKLWLVYPK